MGERPPDAWLAASEAALLHAPFLSEGMDSAASRSGPGAGAADSAEAAAEAVQRDVDDAQALLAAAALYQVMGCAGLCAGKGE